MSAPTLIALFGGFCIGVTLTTFFCLRYARYWVRRLTAPTPASKTDAELFVEAVLSDQGTLCHFSPPLLSLLCGYDPRAPSCVSVTAFKPIASQTECLFARQARVWGNKPFQPELTFEENVKMSIGAFALFCAHLKSVDGFLFCMDGGLTLDSFSDIVRKLLTTLSDADPMGYCCMSKSFIGKRGWVFSFAKTEFFVTTFAPCYPSSSSRYSFTCREQCFVLFQPYTSFLWHKVGDDTPITQWDSTQPQTVRDKIRAKYRTNGRPYPVPFNVETHPAAWNIVRPLQIGDPVVQWWLPPEQRNNAEPVWDTDTDLISSKKHQ